MKEADRKSNYDLLRLLAMIGVIINHTGDIFVFQDCAHKGYVYIFEGIGAFSVPVFFMITGALSIDNEKNRSYRDFYIKKFKSIAVHAIIFSLFYFVWIFAVNISRGAGIMEALELPVYRQIRGWSGHPMWYVYTLMGIYLFIPIIADLRYRYGSKKSYHIFALIFCAWAFLSMYADEGTVAWSIPLVFEFLGFVVLGSEIKYFMENREKSNAWAGLIIISGFLTYILEYILLYVHVGNGGEYYTRYLNSRVAPLSLLGAMLIFSGAVMLNIDLKFKLVAKYSFYIYLFHKWALDVLEIIFWKDDYVPDVRICIPLVVCMTLVLSLILSVMYLGAFKQLSKSLTENKQELKGYGRH